MNLNNLSVASLREIAQKLKIDDKGKGKVALKKAITAKMAGVEVPKDAGLEAKNVFEKQPFAEADADNGQFVAATPKAAQPQAVVEATPVIVTPDDVRIVLVNHTARGLVIKNIDAESWHFCFGVREDSGTMRQALHTIVACATKLCGAAVTPNLDDQDVPGRG